MTEPQFDSFFRRPAPDDARTEVLAPIDPLAEPPDNGGPERVEDPPDDADLRALLEANAGPAVPRLTRALLAGLALVAAFAGGVLVQRHEAPARTGTTVSFARPGGTGQGGFTGTRSGIFGRQGAPAGGSGGSAGGPGAAARGSGDGAAGAPAVVGTVVSVSGRTVTVRNFAGKNVTVTVPDGTPVSQSRALDLSSLKRGTTVSVTGSAGASGAVTATGVTARSGG